MGTITIGKKHKEFYEQYYTSDTEWRKIGAINKSNNVMNLLKDYPHNKILEVGSGTGGILAQLAANNFSKEMYALEISESALKIMKSKKIKNLKECNIFDGYTIPYPDQSFDLVFLAHVIEHVEFPRKLINEASRVGKYAFFEVPLELNKRLKYQYVNNAVGHINFFSKTSFIMLLMSCGLEIVSYKITNVSLKSHIMLSNKFFGFIRFTIKQFVLTMFPKMAMNNYTYHFSVLCKKKEL